MRPAAARILEERFHLTHTTIQIEAAACAQEADYGRDRTFELFEVISYRADVLKGFDSVEYETLAGMQRRNVRAFKTDRDFAQYRSGLVCTYLEYVIVEISESPLRDKPESTPVNVDGFGTFSPRPSRRGGHPGCLAGTQRRRK